MGKIEQADMDTRLPEVQLLLELRNRPLVYYHQICEDIVYIIRDFQGMGCQCQLVGSMKTQGFSRHDVDLLVLVPPQCDISEVYKKATYWDCHTSNVLHWPLSVHFIIKTSSSRHTDRNALYEKRHRIA